MSEFLNKHNPNRKENKLDEYRCVIHGSYKIDKWPQVQQVRDFFLDEGLNVLAPIGDVVGYESGFAILEGEEGQDTRLTELSYLQKVKNLRGSNGFSYFVTAGGYVGRSGLAEHSMATAWGVRTFFNQQPEDMPVYVPNNTVYQPDKLVNYIKKHHSLPPQHAKKDVKEPHGLWVELPKTDQAVGAIMEYTPPRGEKEIFVVQTHQWGDRWSIVGQRLQPGHTLLQTLFEGITEETRNKTGSSPRLLTAFDQIPGSGYHRPAVLTFTDFVVEMGSRRFTLNDEAQRGLWIPARVALEELYLEPNARRSIEAYAARSAAVK